ncbi:hypothetical protein EA472_00285 [Natrarchaeobius oligotrophus]|uniref:Uncharacterized protein n=1 Tax=Natrarchaeobius chitinivorans TaxID=1679083 RepID=A0A3N6MN69_NATCH|nr:hypothetical protein EA472_00285 [Natrarchaeobius chitinivorans]
MGREGTAALDGDASALRSSHRYGLEKSGSSRFQRPRWEPVESQPTSSTGSSGPRCGREDSDGGNSTSLAFEGSAADGR